jgi:hypothetical protein
MDEILADIDDLDRLAEAFAERNDALRAKLRAYRASLGKQGEPVFVGGDGRLTEAGIRYAETAFADGRGPTEIARALGVTVPAMVTRKKKWMESRTKKGAKR